jgi:hypothetical protein
MTFRVIRPPPWIGRDLVRGIDTPDAPFVGISMAAHPENKRKNPVDN